MIISASYKTDIPTFYGEWFINRLRAGYCKTVNPYNSQISRVSLLPSDVDGFVFWTKNLGPFIKHLPEIHALGLPFVIQHTINGYPRALEHSVVDSDKSVANLKRTADSYGSRVCVWRYDTIVLSSITPAEFHKETFARLARSLEGSTDEVVISFAQVYKKTQRNMNGASEALGFQWTDPDESVKRQLLSELVGIAISHRIQANLCSQTEYLVENCGEAHCIDADRLSAVSGKPVLAKEKGNRPQCRCSAARDIGEYDTCPHGCVYCYAVQNRELALSRYREHDPTSEFLFTPSNGVVESHQNREIQGSLFDGNRIQ